MSKRVIIIGGGPAGLSAANGLSDLAAKGAVEVVILDKKDHADLVIGQPRALVNPAFADEALLPFDRVLHGPQKPRVIVVAAVTGLHDGAVSFTRHDGRSETLPADANVVATGSSHRGRFMKNSDGLPKQAWLQRLSEWRTAAGNAKHVLVVGGGVSGVEIAGEFATEHPSCKVTIVNSGPHLCGAGKAMHESVMSGLRSLPGKVEVITGDKVQAEEALALSPRTFTTNAGTAIAGVDMVVCAAGIFPNTSFIHRTRLDPKGFIVVDSTLQAPALTSHNCPVFAIGDVAHCGWGRLRNAQDMGKACVKNLKNLIAGKPLGKVYDTEGGKNWPIFASLGRQQGSASAPIVNKWLARKVKAPSLMVGIAWPKMFGVKDFKLSAAAMGPSPLLPSSKAPLKSRPGVAPSSWVYPGVAHGPGHCGPHGSPHQVVYAPQAPALIAS